MNRSVLITPPAIRRRSVHRGMTLVEMLIALGISCFLSMVIVAFMYLVPNVLAAASRELMVRENNAITLRMLETTLRGSSRVAIYSDYTNLAGSEVADGVTGSCLVATRPSFSWPGLPTSPSGRFIFYYYPGQTSSAVPPPGLYYHSDASTAPNPASDVCVSKGMVLEEKGGGGIAKHAYLDNFEIHRDRNNGSLRIHLQAMAKTSSIAKNRALEEQEHASYRRIHLVTSVRSRM